MSGLGEGRGPSFKRRTLCAAQRVLHASAARWWLRRPGGRHASILMYHSVADTRSADWIAPRNRIAPDRFRRQMQFLAEQRRVVSLSEAVASLRGGEELKPGSVVVTFDDGYLDNLGVAAPILSELGLPATIFVCTRYLETGKPQWADRVYAALRRSTKQPLAIDIPGGEPIDCSRPAVAYDAMTSRMIPLPDDQRDAMLENLEQQLGVNEMGPRRTLLWSEVERCRAEHPTIEFGAHTSSHADLTSLPADAAVAEVEQCSREFEANMGERPVHFSFPYSRASEDVIAKLPEMGYQSAMVGVGGQPGSGDPMQMHRWESPQSLGRLAMLTSGAMPSLSEQFLGRA